MTIESIHNYKLTRNICPACGWTLVKARTGSTLYCTNRETCRQGFIVAMVPRVLMSEAIGEVDDKTYLEELAL